MRKGMGLIGIALACALLALGAGCEAPPSPRKEPLRHTLTLYSFSIAEEVLTKDILPGFQTYWQNQTGDEVTFHAVFTGSEQVADAILSGAPADVAILSNEQHATWLHINDYVRTDWRTFPQQGVISHSPIVIVVRPGNPLGIKDWADLRRPGVQIIHPDPRTSGGAQWALLAEYGSTLLTGGDPQTAQEQLETMWSNVVDAPSSAREALKQFLFGAGNVLITYEQDALLARARGAAIEIIVPRSTIMSEHVIVMVDRNVDRWEQEVVRGFVDYMWSETAQKAMTRYYFRAVTDEALNQSVKEFHKIEQPFTVRALGGWGKAYPDIIHSVWEARIAAR